MAGNGNGKDERGGEADYDFRELYKIISQRQASLSKARQLIEKGIADISGTNPNALPLTLVEQLRFFLRLFEDVNLLYLSNMAILYQFRKGAFKNF